MIHGTWSLKVRPDADWPRPLPPILANGAEFHGPLRASGELMLGTLSPIGPMLVRAKVLEEVAGRVLPPAPGGAEWAQRWSSKELLGWFEFKLISVGEPAVEAKP